MPLKMLCSFALVFLGFACRLTSPSEPVPPWTPDTVLTQLGLELPTLERFTPPAWYREVWDSTARCVQKTRLLIGDKFDETAWYEVVGALSFWNGEDWVLGAWSPYTGKPHRIYLVTGVLDWEWIVAHESVHAMAYVYDHPPDLFNGCVGPWWKDDE